MDLPRPPRNFDRRRHQALYQRLHALLNKQQRNLRPLINVTRVGSLLGAVVFVGTVYGAWLALLSAQRSIAQFSPHPGAASLLTYSPFRILSAELILLSILGVWVVARGVLVGLGAARFYEQEYRRAWQLLAHRWVGPVFAEEEYWRPIYAYQRGALVRQRFGQLSGSLEEHVAFGARFLEALEDLACGAGRLQRFNARQGYLRTGRARLRWMPWVFPPYFMLASIAVMYPLAPLTPLYWLAIPAGLLLGGVFAVFMLAAEGPLLLLERARITALCEYLLDEPGLDVAALPEPEPTGSPLRRQFVALHERISRALGWRGAEA